VIRSVFEDAYNYMKSGHLMRQVINKIVAGDRLQQGAGPPPVRRPLRADPARPAERRQRRRVLHPAPGHPVHGRPVAPQLGEKMLDPACGTGGFLTCAIDHKRKQHVKTVEQDEAVAAVAASTASRRSRCRTCCAPPT
jgi:type I restriction enzyme M protein